MTLYIHLYLLSYTNSNSGTSSETSCEFYVWRGDTLGLSSGLYTDTLTNVDGCDSISNIKGLVILDQWDQKVQKHIYTNAGGDPYTWSVDGQTYTSMFGNV